MLQQLRVPAEHRTGKCSWVPPGRCQCSPIPPGTSSRCQQCWTGKRRSHPSSLAWLQKGEQGSSSPFPALPGELRVPCTLLAGLQIPKSSSTMKIKIKPKPVLLEQSWSQVLDKAQEFSEQGDPFGASPSPLPCKSCRKAAPWESLPPSPPPLGASGSSHGWCHLPASLCQPSRANSTRQAGRRGRGRGNKGSPGCCGAPWINSAPIPGRDYNRKRQSLISGGVRSSGSCMDRHSMGNQHLHPIQLLLPVPAWHNDPACSFTGREILVREGPRNIQGCPRKDPCTSPHLRV